MPATSARPDLDVDRYLARIGYAGAREPSPQTLRDIHVQHLLTVPFENLDVGRRPILIDETAFVRKIVDERRGGFCYELNGAFAALLRALGFDVTLVSAGVAREAGGFGPDYDHLALLVRMEGEEWLADVGFGDSFVEPLRFVPDVDQGEFRVRPAPDPRPLTPDPSFILYRSNKPQYRFTRTPRELREYAAMCHYHQTSPQSSFTQKTVCSLATRDGRVTLSNRRLITTTNGARVERDLSDNEYRTVLRDHFGIQLG